MDLTEAYEQLAALAPAERAAEVPQPALPAPPRELAFNAVTAEFADGLLMEQAELEKITDLLWERKQIIFYGPPGTGKT